MAATIEHRTTSMSTLGEYPADAVRPLVSLIFVTPLLLIYEAGVLLLGPQALRNGADVWLRQILEFLGFGQYFLLPLLTCGILLSWHHLQQKSWRLKTYVLWGMLVESIVFALVLLAIARMHQQWFAAVTANTGSEETVVTRASVARLIGYCGAGIYEELMFRLMLLPAVAGACRMLGVSWKTSLVVAMISTSLVFSAAHYQIFTDCGDVFQWYSFAFRFAAGMFFSLLFVMRGFGIAAGSHALYDILVEFV